MSVTFLTDEDKTELLNEIGKSVKHTEQTLTDEQKAQARANIGAADAKTVDSIVTTKNLFTGAELVEGAYYNAYGEQTNATYNYYKAQLSAGTYKVRRAARYIYNATTEELILDDGYVTEKTFTLAADSLCYITVFAQFSSEDKLFSAEYAHDEVERIGEYSLNEDKIPSIAEIRQDVADNERNISGLLKSFTTKNLLDGAELVEGAFFAYGKENASSTYKYYKNVFLPAGEYGTFGIVRFVSNLATGTDVVNNGSVTRNISFTVADEGIYHITFIAADTDPKVFSSEYTADEVESIGEYTLAPNINVPNVSAEFEYRNMLTGKKWVACGDSFTQGVASEGAFTEGMYTGKNKVYPYYIGNRCGMNVINEAIGGTTMTYLGTMENAFSNLRYQQIPADADYITLKFGINDDTYHQNAPIGTIDDTTNATFYGAWNVVMEHLITNHTTAHIGIIVTNGSVGGYAEATIAIAKKWGIPYLDMATGEQVPLSIRSNRSDVCNAAKNIRMNTFRVSETDTHPNAVAHEYESRYIEAWLMTI